MKRFCCLLGMIKNTIVYKAKHIEVNISLKFSYTFDM